MKSEQEKVERVHCNLCGLETRHVVVATRVHTESELVREDIEISWRNEYTMLQCLGCEAVCLRQRSWFSEEPDREDIYFYPPQVSRQMPKWSNKLKFRYQMLLHETYAALHADSRTLAIMGARALIDMVMQDKVGDIGGFKEKLDALVHKGYLSKLNRDILAAALDAGNAAAHRGHRASAEEVNHVMDIVENLLQADLLAEAARQLKSATPIRSRQSTASTYDAV